MAKKIVLSVLMAVLTFAFVWGVYISVLLITLRSEGEASYAVALICAMTLQLITYRLAPRRLTRLQRWLGCSAGALLLMLIFKAAFGEGTGNFKSLGGSFNLTLLLAMLIFAAVTGLYELIAHFLMHRVKVTEDDTDDDTEEDNNNEQ